MATEHVTETRWSWLWYFLKWTAYAEPRPATPREMALLDQISHRDDTIERLTLDIDIAKEDAIEASRVAAIELDAKERHVSKLESEIEMLKMDVEFSSELFQKAMNRAKAESAAYAKLIPGDGK